jgi:hypothetical protein
LGSSRLELKSKVGQGIKLRELPALHPVEEQPARFHSIPDVRCSVGLHALHLREQCKAPWCIKQAAFKVRINALQGLYKLEVDFTDGCLVNAE